MEQIKTSVNWDYFNKFDSINDSYLPETGEGDTMATQICTVVNKLVYKWYNDGDVYDNTYMMDGWCNDLSSYANWLYQYVPESRSILVGITVDVYDYDGYENLLKQLADTLLDKEFIEDYVSIPKKGSVYNCGGPFRVVYEYEDE